ncbi:monoamine oxidase [Rhizobium subbaraonis]|uniref:Monoamine oxidase n=1 Tax=Rhizobium subbaraonis TaxID=908946 RepID=A0A285UIL2_9HYPH|nr:FAD-dependent oxidoreductase [Rhizobium subbaraonis]SOC40436.1 monoamine oxidase [Rhizobium subbaraonis]
MAQHHDVIVVGAGFTGLSAAAVLFERGLDVVVLEAQARVGGRVAAQTFADGGRVDTGGQFVCDDMTNVMALIRRYGKTLVQTPVEGAFVVQPAIDAPDKAYAESRSLRLRMRALNPRDPAIDGMSVADWLAAQPVSADAARAFRSTVEGLWCRPIGELPLWYLVSNDRRITNRQSEIEYFVGETIHSLADDMAAGLDGRVLTGRPVTQISMRVDRVQVQAGEALLSARHVVVAVPPVATSRIGFEPDLPAALRRALSVWRSGAVIKALVRYPRPFWRERGLSGMVSWLDPSGLFACDVSHDGLGAALVVFVGGPLAIAAQGMPPASLEAMILGKLADVLGEPARTATAILLRDWTGDAWSGGGYSDTVCDLRAKDAEDVLRSGAGRIQFACSELSLSYPGYIEGAIVAGRMAAERIMAAGGENAL